MKRRKFVLPLLLLFLTSFITYFYYPLLWRKNYYVVDSSANSSDNTTERLSMIVLSNIPFPRVYLLAHFLSREEVEHLLRVSGDMFQPSQVIEPRSGDLETDSQVRSNSQCWLPHDFDAVVAEIDYRIAEITDTDVNQGEPLQVLHYDVGEQFVAHADFLDDGSLGGHTTLSSHSGGQRILTVVMYLRKPLRGGETVFPYLDLAVSPDPGDALLFYNVAPSGEPHALSVHAGARVLEGEKIVASKWIHERCVRCSAS